MPDQDLTIDGLAELLDVPRTWVRDKVTARQLPFHKRGRHVRFTPEDVAEIRASGAVSVVRAPLRIVRGVA